MAALFKEPLIQAIEFPELEKEEVITCDDDGKKKVKQTKMSYISLSHLHVHIHIHRIIRIFSFIDIVHGYDGVGVYCII